MDKDKLRKADLLTSLIIFVFGLAVSFEAFGMPMTDSYGGVQNVWYVSPALFPLFVGLSIAALGLALFKVALSEVGVANAIPAIKSLFADDGDGGIFSETNFRFLAIVLLFVSYVYLLIPRIDFFIASLLFLFTFINMFHLDDITIFKKMFVAFLLISLMMIIFFATGLDQILGGETVHPGDWLACVLLAALIVFTRRLVGTDPALKRRFKHGTIVAFASPFILGPIFKFFLLVPLPYEGIVVEFLDKLWYWEF